MTCKAGGPWSNCPMFAKEPRCDFQRGSERRIGLSAELVNLMLIENLRSQFHKTLNKLTRQSDMPRINQSALYHSEMDLDSMNATALSSIYSSQTTLPIRWDSWSHAFSSAGVHGISQFLPLQLLRNEEHCLPPGAFCICRGLPAWTDSWFSVTINHMRTFPSEDRYRTDICNDIVAQRNLETRLNA